VGGVGWFNEFLCYQSRVAPAANESKRKDGGNRGWRSSQPELRMTWHAAFENMAGAQKPKALARGQGENDKGDVVMYFVPSHPVCPRLIHFLHTPRCTFQVYCMYVLHRYIGSSQCSPRNKYLAMLVKLMGTATVICRWNLGAQYQRRRLALRAPLRWRANLI
jgi:hypothetical protein